MIPVLEQPTEVQTMTCDLRSIDLATLSIAREVIVDAIQNQVIDWERQSQDAVANGNLSNALLLEHWAFSAELLATSVGTEFGNLFIKALDARFGTLSATNRSAEDQILDALTLKAVTTQEVLA
jgi:hypothetical protein